MAILVVLALPILGLRLGFSDEGNYPDDTTTRQAYDLLADGFGPGFNGPLILASEVPEGTDPATLAGGDRRHPGRPRRRPGRARRSPTTRPTRPRRSGG